MTRQDIVNRLDQIYTAIDQADRDYWADFCITERKLNANRLLGELYAEKKALTKELIDFDLDNK